MMWDAGIHAVLGSRSLQVKCWGLLSPHDCGGDTEGPWRRSSKLLRNVRNYSPIDTTSYMNLRQYRCKNVRSLPFIKCSIRVRPTGQRKNVGPIVEGQFNENNWTHHFRLKDRHCRTRFLPVSLDNYCVTLLECCLLLLSYIFLDAITLLWQSRGLN